MRAKKLPIEKQNSCENCKHRFVLPKEKGHLISEVIAECRSGPMIYIQSLDTWASPPAPADFLCGEHVLKFNS